MTYTSTRGLLQHRYPWMLVSTLTIGALAAVAQAPPKPTATAAPANTDATVRYDPANGRPRVIVTTDGEIDDRCSMVRFLMYANEWDIEGLIYSSSKFHWLGHTWSGVEWLNAQIDQYARVYPNLRQHADGYPTPDQLKRLVYVGNIKNVGEMEEDSPGADRIVQVLLDDKPSPVYLQAWGGTNTIARALAKIQKEHPEAVEKISRRAIIYIILDQDDTFRKYIEPNWPKLQVLGSFRQFGALAYAWKRLMPPTHRVFFERPWMEGNITVDKGPLAGAYEANDGAFRSEGDSPAFMHQIDVGLRSLEHPYFGGWGGRFVEEKPGVTNVWKDAADDGNVTKPIWRWAEAFQNDWAARADWCVKPWRQANHPPVAFLQTPKDVQASPGATVTISVRGSTDPDGDKLTYSWWHYRDVGTYKQQVLIQGEDRAVASVQIPRDAKAGDTIHLIAEVTDSGKPPLTRYSRVIVTVSEPGRASN